MSSVSLFFIGAVLVVNGLALLGRIEPTGAAPVNAFVGIVLVAAAGRLALPTGADEAALLAAAPGHATVAPFRFRHARYALDATFSARWCSGSI